MPWYVEAENVTPDFGSRWFSTNLYICAILREYLDKFPNELITSVGDKTLGRLNFGKDKLKLALGFARFVMEK
ncbi:hypothetical protein HMPREF0765_3073 [Sphingobacterium spiritivorum ATCC 33300]|uniref:Uncharacterized protein n=1 Tax=Sphingobacterium spiritivorum ATCC 33300 TaxID=525372 RepID=C2G0H3_SPHSI|nr:hypothetical protein HMPREF0765_3073 [Sphingobacterium spiritivorum ATCC 33300]